ncbi:gephyrin-like molybdotransferase Glp [Fodinibius sp.]|uniref:molybdopterin molybdotransferase MoeA n=1 Tax=Fodinibius sp. TaxID=1872440 RepID=UPI002ACE9FDA|nr:gephyrin-like molybdotransferase Glp [Fodinibius sp.]MDZ7659377.1 gephyrin-like molybdotransferase Glp [Fodinibius sp.]
MISISEAKSLLFESIEPLQPTEVSTVTSEGYILADNLFSNITIPMFDQSAMDGYAVRVADNKLANQEHITLPVKGEVQAGGYFNNSMPPNSAVRIFTGAAVPDQTRCVVRQEYVQTDGKSVTISTEDIASENNIRPAGSRIKKGDLALKKGTKLTPAAIGFLNALGISEAEVIQKPEVAILATGNELRKPGEELQPGEIYESNSSMLNAALQQSGFTAQAAEPVRDISNELKTSLENLLNKFDVVITTGGISVGKYDLVKQTLEELGVEQIFYKVKQKPGKPIYAGKKENKLVFALPGNPASALVCFYEYVLPSLKKMSGEPDYELPKKSIPLAHSFMMNDTRDIFFKAKIKDGVVTILGGQGSDMLQTFAEANALVLLPAGEKQYEPGDNVETHLLPL